VTCKSEEAVLKKKFKTQEDENNTKKISGDTALPHNSQKVQQCPQICTFYPQIQMIVFL